MNLLNYILAGCVLLLAGYVAVLFGRTRTNRGKALNSSKAREFELEGSRDDVLWERGRGISVAKSPQDGKQITARAFFRGLAGAMVVIAGIAASRGKSISWAERVAGLSRAKGRKTRSTNTNGEVEPPVHVDGGHFDSAHTDSAHFDSNGNHIDSTTHQDHTDGGVHNLNHLDHSDYVPHTDNAHDDSPHVDYDC